MQVLVNRPVTIDDLTLGRGTHVVDDTLIDHWFFQGLVDQGSIVIIAGSNRGDTEVDDPEPEDQETSDPKIEDKQGRGKARK